MRLLAITAFLVSFTAYGCAEEDSYDDDERDPPLQAIVGDANHRDQASQVGLLSLSNGHWCSATLIAKRTILTAAHCFDYQSRTDNASSGHVFGRTGSDGSSYSRTVLRYVSLGKATGRDDIAVAELDVDVDEWTGISDIWTIEPLKGYPASLYGFGCDNPNWNTVSHDWDCSFGVEQWMHAANTSYTGLSVKSTNGDMAPLIAHGDSGGPMLAAGKVVAVISAMSNTFRKKDGALISTQATLASVFRNQAFIQKWRDTFH